MIKLDESFEEDRFEDSVDVKLYAYSYIFMPHSYLIKSYTLTTLIIQDNLKPNLKESIPPFVSQAFLCIE